MNSNRLLGLEDWQSIFSQMTIGSDGMPSAVSDLTEDQKYFFDHVGDGHKPLFLERLSVYRNNVHQSLIQALADSFPVTQQLVGEDFFAVMAKEYLYKSPPKSAVLLEFGDSFPEFIKSFQPAETLAYLADVAELEYRWLCAYHAEDAESLAAEYFSTLAAESQSLYECQLRCHPSLQLMNSDFAVGSIWQMHQDHSDDSETNSELKIDEPEWLIVVRPEYEVQVCFVDEPSYRFIERLNQSAALGVVIAELTESFPDWDIGQSLAFAIQNGFFISAEIQS